MAACSLVFYSLCGSRVNFGLKPSLQEELGVPYEVVKWQRSSDHLAPKELRDVHPLGLAPIIVDGGVIIAESGAIVRKKTFG